MGGAWREFPTRSAKCPSRDAILDGKGSEPTARNGLRRPPLGGEGWGGGMRLRKRRVAHSERQKMGARNQPAGYPLGG
jgi:hypothetical protein